MDATSDVAQEVGSSRLTIDAVVRRSGISKGGILYHYPTKRALIAGLLEYSIEQLDARVNRWSKDTGGRSPKVRALIKASAATPIEETTLPLSVLVAAAEDHTILAPMKQYSGDWLSEAESEGDLSVILMLAVEGLQFLEMLNLVNLSVKKRKAILKTMLTMLDDLEEQS